MRLQHCLHKSVLTTPYALLTLLTILTLAELLECPPICSQYCLPSLRSQSSLPHAPDTAYHPYAQGVHSRHAPNTSYHPYACVVPSQHAPTTVYHPYARGVPSQHAPHTTYPYASILHP
ncbi:hypothetical protein O181_071639 [Austropuccinia psidii MF-1]|uniref:Uncharacterized protein n=1 Tax=Austropuccinia psidii MF-1 TaxID=1389203 RepID=A0A9Q3IAP6_9BASI|nr:hypothetical protein [Austropuccinia psidii MF-1]